MTEIYYCRNEDDMKRVAIYLFQSGVDCTCVEDGITDAGLYSCDYKPEEIECCEECEDECLLYEHLEDRNVHKHIELLDSEVEYPCIVCVADTYYNDERITVCSVQEAKENTKYGYV